MIAGRVAVDELVNLAITITGDIRNDGGARRLFLMTMQWHDREELINGPGIGQGLEDREISVVKVGQIFLNLRQFFGDAVEGLKLLGNEGDDVPVGLFSISPVTEMECAEVEESANLIPVKESIIESFGEGLWTHSFNDLRDIEQHRVGVRRRFLRSMRHVEARDIENIEGQNRVVSHHRAAGLRDDVRVRYLRLVAGF